MDNSFSIKEIFLIFFGFGYMVNHRSKEVHRMSMKHKNCQLDTISKNHSEYVTKSTAKRLIKKFGYNGCRWCWPVADKG